MGLGKTAQTICFLGLLQHAALQQWHQRKQQQRRQQQQQQQQGKAAQAWRLPGGPKPHIIVCPSSLLENWERELKRWCPKLRCTRVQALVPHQAPHGSSVQCYTCPHSQPGARASCTPDGLLLSDVPALEWGHGACSPREIGHRVMRAQWSGAPSRADAHRRVPLQSGSARGSHRRLSPGHAYVGNGLTLHVCPPVVEDVLKSMGAYGHVAPNALCCRVVTYYGKARTELRMVLERWLAAKQAAQKVVGCCCAG